MNDNNTTIGRVIATENCPTTMDYFYFWTDKDLVLNPFDVVVVENQLKDGTESQTFAVIEEISHITDSASFLSDFISSDFGDVHVNSPTHRIGMNYVKANVVGNSKNIFIPVQSNAAVRLASTDEISIALGFDEIQRNSASLVCGYIEMYENVHGNEVVSLPVPMDSRYLIGPEGAHLNISGISGLAAKTSYAMFLLKAIQNMQLMFNEDENNSVAFVIFNVKGKDLLAIDEENTFEGNEAEKKRVHQNYLKMGINPVPFKNVSYFYPYRDSKSVSSYIDAELFQRQERLGKAYKYKFLYQDDRENLDLLFADIDDSTHTMDGILSNITAGIDRFGNLSGWKEFLDEIEEKTKAGNSTSKEIPVQSWRKFYRLIKKTIYNNGLFGTKVDKKSELRLQTALSKIEKNSVYVIDIANLPTDMQGFVFGNVIREIYNLQLGVTENVGNNKPRKIIVFMDELNKFASTDIPKSSPILRQILDIAERGRSLGVILFGAEQFKSALHNRVSGNCSTFAYGRTNAIEVSKGDYTYVPKVYKSMMTRLKQGEYIIQNPIFKSMVKVKFPEPLYRQFK